MRSPLGARVVTFHCWSSADAIPVLRAPAAARPAPANSTRSAVVLVNKIKLLCL
jgi:hypothetical protein